MLDRETFKAGLKKLVIEYSTKGFTMNEKRVSQWYDYLNYMCDSEFNERIEYILKNCPYAPSMADIFKADVKMPKTIL